jgi:hypothetical protein
VPPDIEELKDWWDEIGAPNSVDDKSRVKEARNFGGQMALKRTAGVPATMFLGYLLLVLFFRSRGGYTTVEIEKDDDGLMQA